jgi:NAD(P)-dependent dehydrogenase (short-subunit alcohol dehydrogenase family)
LAATVKTIRAAAGTAQDIPADVSKEKEIVTLVEKTEAVFGPIDILVNNAGMHARHVPIHQHKTSTWDKTMALNLRAPFLLARAVIPHMRRQEYGHIVNISSIAGLHVFPESGAYTISKHGLNALTELIQVENQDHNIHVHAICPGMVDAPMADGLPTVKENMLTPEQVAELVRWLVTQPDNVKIAQPILMDTMKNPWQKSNSN